LQYHLLLLPPLPSQLLHNTRCCYLRGGEDVEGGRKEEGRRGKGEGEGGRRDGGGGRGGKRREIPDKSKLAILLSLSSRASNNRLASSSPKLQSKENERKKSPGIRKKNSTCSPKNPVLWFIRQETHVVFFQNILHTVKRE
jgi:hypothetical protein